jgi:hypothetical protein
MGVQLDYPETVGSGELPSFGPLGTQVFGSDGKRYVFAKATATIGPSDADCSVNASTFAATATGGSYLSPAVSMVSGDFGWFAATSV